MYIVTAKEMYGIDQYTTEEIGMEGKLLMENAGRAISEKIESKAEMTDLIMVIAGSGNNGGDGYVIARTMLNMGYETAVIQVVPDAKITGDARYHKNLYINCGGSVSITQDAAEVEGALQESDIVVDAILGIGAKGKLREPVKEIVEVINDCDAYVISVDIPSGLPADEGAAAFDSVQADCTVIVGFPKMSAFLQHTTGYYGEWETVAIGFPGEAQTDLTRSMWTHSQFLQTMPERRQNSHKSDHGRGLIIGGSEEMPGSISMTVRAALRAGAGLITAGTVKQAIPVVASQCIEATHLKLGDTNGYISTENTIPYENYDAVVLGMGLGRHETTRSQVKEAVSRVKGPLILDADGLFHIRNELNLLIDRTNPTVVTPHPGEMAMLTGVSAGDILQEPFSYAKTFAQTYGVYVVLKGTYTIVTAPDGRQSVNTTGNQGLAKGGSGDVLSGIILAMAMQHNDLYNALRNACYVHGKAADILIAQSHSVYDLMASDVVEGIAKVYRTLTDGT
ncbi:bifunctional ADP-dependent NAD(P)H-hydrate dehydratase/NAD(P)H-hydrate epimerase [Virgibacillus siamensis]|uniref:bifunctional ADP-dependent NAD(P)H-hydrate dehydratase/NAD(P)H-hydrate epimerase n=1 Tax=Virgibacillus siamensis TaxID=480071 RepID=UPI00098688D8|nr:bifunctional ADP-dependent NAD(P)H-hydrate dehydratase/NAD(P)H-hydrate epimerase [Virgibacillus siamensis]